jgi:hypothetical protein
MDGAKFADADESLKNTGDDWGRHAFRLL